MEVILLERVGRLGTMGDVVKVRNGFARNFLIPQHKALRATKDNKAEFEKRRSEIEAKNNTARAEAEAHAKKIEGAVVTLIRQASEDGKLYGSVVVRDIAEELNAQGHKVERKHIELNTSIKNIGSYQAKVRLHAEVAAPITIIVARTEGEAAAPVETAKEEDAA